MVEKNDEKEFTSTKLFTFLEPSETISTDNRVKIPDGGIRAWLVCLSTSFTLGTIFLIINSFGVIYDAFQKEYLNSEDTSLNFKTSSVWSLGTGMIFGFSPISSILIDKFGIRIIAFLGGALTFSGMLLTSFVPSYHLVYLTYGVIFGTGASLMNTASVVILGHYFKRRLGRANGLVMTGSGCLLIAAPYFHKLIIQHLGVRHDFHILSAFLSLFMLYAVVWKPTFNSRLTSIENEDECLSQGEVSRLRKIKQTLNKVIRFENVKNKNYVIWMVAMVTSNFGYYIPFVHMVKYVETKNSSFDGPGLLTLMSVASVISRLAIGFMADHPKINRLFLLQSSFALMCICTVAFPLVNDYIGLGVLIFILGLCDGCKITLFGPIAMSLVGPYGLSQAVGLLMGLGSIPSMCGPSLAGFLFDALGTYDIVFYMAGIPPIVAAILMMFIKDSSKESQPEEEVVV